MKTKKIYIIRHGQTDFNLRSIVQGRGVNSSLNELGGKQAAAFYEYYNKEGFQIIYTSTLKRTIESVAPFIELGIPYVELSGLDEIDWGVYEGKEANFEEQLFFRELTKKWASGETHLALENGESPEEVVIRQKEAIEKFKRAEEDKILVCMHGRALRILLTQLLQLPLTSMDKFEHHNLCLYVVEYNGSKFKLIAENEISHLKDVSVESKL